MLPGVGDPGWQVDRVHATPGRVEARWSRAQPGRWAGRDTLTRVAATEDELEVAAAAEGLPGWDRGDVLVGGGAGLGNRPRPRREVSGDVPATGDGVHGGEADGEHGGPSRGR